MQRFLRTEGEIVTDLTTAATECYYCQSPVVLSERVSGEYLPQEIIPFAIDRKKAEEIFLQNMKKKKFIISIVAIVILAAIALTTFGKKDAQITFETTTVEPDTIRNSVTATGTIEPVTEVEVGTQVSGIIDKIYVDYNSVVTKGQLIAEMDRVTLQSELASQRAAYNGAKAEYEYQQKNYERNKARLFTAL